LKGEAGRSKFSSPSQLVRVLGLIVLSGFRNSGWMGMFGELDLPSTILPLSKPQTDEKSKITYHALWSSTYTRVGRLRPSTLFYRYRQSSLSTGTHASAKNLSFSYTSCLPSSYTSVISPTHRENSSCRTSTFLRNLQWPRIRPFGASYYGASDYLISPILHLSQFPYSTSHPYD
jgi:hypothetical protein